MRWLSKLARAWRTRKDIPHPAGPALDPIKGPKAHYEYFVHEQPDLIWWEARAYLPVKNEDGTWGQKVVTVTSPANSVASARHYAQAWGLAQVKEYKT